MSDFNKMQTAVNVHEYAKAVPEADMEYVITMSSGHGMVLDFMTLASKEEAEEICEDYGWEFKDENEFVWDMDIEEREVSLEVRLDKARDRTDYSPRLKSGVLWINPCTSVRVCHALRQTLIRFSG